MFLCLPPRHQRIKCEGKLSFVVSHWIEIFVFLFMVYLRILSMVQGYTAPDVWMISEYWVWCGRKRSWLDLRGSPVIFVEGWTKLRKTSVTIAGLHAEIRTWDLPNMKQECCPLYRRVWWYESWLVLCYTVRLILWSCITPIIYVTADLLTCRSFYNVVLIVAIRKQHQDLLLYNQIRVDEAKSTSSAPPRFVVVGY